MCREESQCTRPSPSRRVARLCSRTAPGADPPPSPWTKAGQSELSSGISSGAMSSGQEGIGGRKAGARPREAGRLHRSPRSPGAVPPLALARPGSLWMKRRRQRRREGGPGNDTVNGGKESDQLYGGAGRDTMRGGLGRDRIFAVDRPRDVITCCGAATPYAPTASTGSSAASSSAGDSAQTRALRLLLA
jgi:hypothetical protein